MVPPNTFPRGGRCRANARRMRGYRVQNLSAVTGACAPYTTSVICSFLANASFSSRRSLLRREQAPALRYCYRCVVFVGASIARPPVGYRTGATDGQWPPLQGVLILFVGAIYRSSAISYRQELILAVISRTLFCRVVLPLFSSCSTLLMA